MVERFNQARRIARVAVGAVRAIFRAGKAWGGARTRVKTARRPTPRAAGPGLAAGAAAGAAGAYFLDPQSGKRRRHVAFDRARALVRKGAAESERKARYAAGATKGAAYEAAGAGDGVDTLPDPDLANKVRTEIFRDADAPKGEVNVNAEHGVVYLRGEIASPDRIEALVAAAREVKGVRDVVSLLHGPEEPAPAKEPKRPPARPSAGKR